MSLAKFRSKKYVLLALIFSTTAWAQSSMRSVECTTAETTALNRFTLSGTIEISEKGIAKGDLTLTTQMAGRDTPISEPILFRADGTARTYAARSLGAEQVTLVRIKTTLHDRVYSLIIASGLEGPQSTLTVQGIPFRAECKLK